jgi:hypothetical protein
MQFSLIVENFSFLVNVRDSSPCFAEFNLPTMTGLLPLSTTPGRPARPSVVPRTGRWPGS